jgi:hypothetical protein
MQAPPTLPEHVASWGGDAAPCFPQHHDSKNDAPEDRHQLPLQWTLLHHKIPLWACFLQAVGCKLHFEMLLTQTLNWQTFCWAISQFEMLLHMLSNWGTNSKLRRMTVLSSDVHFAISTYIMQENLATECHNWLVNFESSQVKHLQAGMRVGTHIMCQMQKRFCPWGKTPCKVTKHILQLSLFLHCFWDHNMFVACILSYFETVFMLLVQLLVSLKILKCGAMLSAFQHFSMDHRGK